MSQKEKKKFQLHPIQIGMEIAIVAIGIIIAFQLSNWRLSRDRTQTEINILKEIKSNLELDLIDIEANLFGHKRKLQCIDSLRNYEQYEFTEEATGSYIISIFRDYILTPQTSAFETLKAKGVDLITNDSLRMSVLRMYDFYYISMIKMEEEWDAAKFDQDLRYIGETYYDRFDLVSLEFKSKSGDNSWLKNADIQLRMDFVSNNMIFLIQSYEMILEEVNSTIAAIEEELANR